MEPEFRIGQQFMKSRYMSKRKESWTIVDILRTYNNAGDLVKVRYVAEREGSRIDVGEHGVEGNLVSVGCPSF
jgi:hypothetical protein